MMTRLTAGVALALVLAACEQQSQVLPFSPDSGETTVRSLSPSTAGSITSPAGATVRFPVGSLPRPTEVSITPAEAPASLEASGDAASSAFVVAPAGLALTDPAEVEMKFDAAADPSRAWLASLAVTDSNGVQEIGSTRVDLGAGLVQGAIDGLGTVAVVLPEPEAVFVAGPEQVAASLGALPTTLLAGGTDSIVVSCGNPDGRCGGLSLESNDDLWDHFSLAAAVFPQARGSLRIAGSKASGELVVSSAIRLLLRSGAAAANIYLHGVLRATEATRVTEDAKAITLSNMRLQVGSRPDGADGPEVVIGDVVITKAGGQGYATVSRTVHLPDTGNGPERTSIAITFPVQIHQ